MVDLTILENGGTDRCRARTIVYLTVQWWFASSFFGEGLSLL